MPDAPAACAWQAALEQRAALMDAVWADACSARPSFVPLAALPPVAREPARLRSYAVSLLRCPDGAWRVARDRVGSHPGAALLEAPLLAAFLPALCRLLLGRSLLLCSLPAWPYADPATAARLTAHPARHTVRDGFDPASPVIPLGPLPPAGRVALQAAVDRAPHRFLVGPHWPGAERRTLSLSVNHCEREGVLTHGHC